MIASSTSTVTSYWYNRIGSDALRYNNQLDIVANVQQPRVRARCSPIRIGAINDTKYGSELISYKP